MSARAHITSVVAIIAFVTAVASADQEEPFSSCPLSEAMERIAQIGLQHNMYFAPHDVNISAEAIHENATRI